MPDQDERTPPHYKPGQFIEYNGRLFKVALAFFLTSAPDRWQLFLEPREGVGETKEDWYYYGIESLPRIFPTPLPSLEKAKLLYQQSGYYWCKVSDGNLLGLVDDSVLVRDSAEIVSSGAVLLREAAEDDSYQESILNMFGLRSKF